MGTHVLSAHYTNRVSFLSTEVSRIGYVMDRPIKLIFKNVIGGEVEEWAVVEMVAEARCKMACANCRK